MSPDECRPVEVTVDGKTETVRVHGAAPMSPEGAAAMGQLVEAVRDRMATDGQTVRQRTLAVLREHHRSNNQCRCGRPSQNATIWSGHVVRALAEAGVLLPLDQRMADQP